jgi:hypothetical protein
VIFSYKLTYEMEILINIREGDINLLLLVLVSLSDDFSLLKFKNHIVPIWMHQMHILTIFPYSDPQNIKSNTK